MYGIRPDINITNSCAPTTIVGGLHQVTVDNDNSGINQLKLFKVTIQLRHCVSNQSQCVLNNI